MDLEESPADERQILKDKKAGRMKTIAKIWAFDLVFIFQSPAL
jgi:hypothetical protein